MVLFMFKNGFSTCNDMLKYQIIFPSSRPNFFFIYIKINPPQSLCIHGTTCSPTEKENERKRGACSLLLFWGLENQNYREMLEIYLYQEIIYVHCDNMCFFYYFFFFLIPIGSPFVSQRRLSYTRLESCCPLSSPVQYCKYMWEREA